MNADEMWTQHGIEVRGDGTVYDSFEDRTFKNLNEWAAYIVAIDFAEEENDMFDTGKWGDYDNE